MLKMAPMVGASPTCQLQSTALYEVSFSAQYSGTALAGNMFLATALAAREGKQENFQPYLTRVWGRTVRFFTY